MAQCKECLHYEVCAKEGRLVQVDEHTWDEYNKLDDVEQFCTNYFTADVVPRSEVERLQAEKDALIKNYAECMKDYASEIFAEIEEVLNRKISRTKPQFERLHDKENSLSIWGYKDMGYFRGVVSICEDVQDLIAELKKEIHGGI